MSLQEPGDISVEPTCTIAHSLLLCK